jgi:hypothetical protein
VSVHFAGPYQLLTINCLWNCGIGALLVRDFVQVMGVCGFRGCAKLASLVFDGQIVQEFLGFQDSDLARVVVPASIRVRGIL